MFNISQQGGKTRLRTVPPNKEVFLQKLMES